MAPYMHLTTLSIVKGKEHYDRLFPFLAFMRERVLRMHKPWMQSETTEYLQNLEADDPVLPKTIVGALQMMTDVLREKRRRCKDRMSNELIMLISEIERRIEVEIRNQPVQDIAPTQA